MKGSRRRLDAELVRRGLVTSRDRAREAVASGRVTVNGAVAQKAARLVLPGDALELSGPPARYVSRGGEKLEGALAAFGLDVTGLRCCDVGSSTGGFTDCLLQRGAAEVVAIDVGRAQMHERLAEDRRVALYERTDIRDVDPAAIGAPFNLVTADVSFISLTSIMTHLAELVAQGAPVVVLVKPQFEVGRQEASRGRGVIRDPELWRAAIDRVLVAATELGVPAQGAAPSLLMGARGNTEFFLHLKKGGNPSPVDSARVVAQAARGILRQAQESSGSSNG